MPRYCVTVTRPKAFFVDADSMVEASELAVDWELLGARPEYSLAAETDVVAVRDEDSGMPHVTVVSGAPIVTVSR